MDKEKVLRLVFVASHQAGLAELRESLAISPVDGRTRVMIGQLHMYRLQPQEALAVFRQTREALDPLVRGPHAAWALFLLGRRAEAAAVLDRSLAFAPRDRNGTFAGMRAVLAAAEGQNDEAEAQIRRAAAKQRGSVHFHHTEYSIGTAYALMERPDSAVKWLRAAAEEGFPCYPLFARDPSLDRLRSDPAFVALLRELRGKWEGSREAATALLAHEAGEPAETLELPSGGGSSNIPVVARVSRAAAQVHGPGLRVTWRW